MLHQQTDRGNELQRQHGHRMEWWLRRASQLPVVAPFPAVCGPPPADEFEVRLGAWGYVRLACPPQRDDESQT